MSRAVRLLATLASWRQRLLFRGAFLLLALATVGMALHVLQEEKQRSQKSYRLSFEKTKEQIAARLRHPSGQLALLNPHVGGEKRTPLRPVVLPFATIAFDDRHKVQHAVEMAGCLVRYRNGGALCVAIGNNPWAGGFIYAVGNFESGALVPHAIGDRDFSRAHRVRVTVALRGQTYRWLAPFESIGAGRHGRLTGFVDADDFKNARPVRDFRGWLWQNGHCSEPTPEPENCLRTSFFSVRLPVGLLRDALFEKGRVEWPPADLDRIEVRLEVLPPGDETPLFDSNADGGVAPFALPELATLLLPGEALAIKKLAGKGGGQELIRLAGTDNTPDASSPLMQALIRRLPADGRADGPISADEDIATPLGTYRISLTGDARRVNRNLAAVATRLSWFIGAMLAAILLAWLVIEIGIVSPIARLTRRAQAVSSTMRASSGVAELDVADMRGSDELGILANCLHELLQRVKEDVAREKIRAEQEKDMWHAVGHEIMSPLQSLLALHGKDGDQSSRYLNRMQQALRILYGSASPSEAFQSSTLRVRAVDIDAFLANVAANAAGEGIADVRYAGGDSPCLVRADEYPLEDVLTHLLRNADRCRIAGTPITLALRANESTASVSVHNVGPNIAADFIERIFEYGVSDQPNAGANGNRGQGLFVAKTYMAKMGGTIAVENVADGVRFVLSLQRASEGGVR